MQGNTVYEPGIETIDDLVRKIPMRDSILLKLFLPKREDFPGVGGENQKSESGITVIFKLSRSTDNLELESRQGRRTLIYGITILIICLLLSGLGFYISSNATTTLQYALGGFMFNGFMIIGWVSLWTPTSMLVFERWPDWISRNTFERISRVWPLMVLPAER